jgi:hypothetical protein
MNGKQIMLGAALIAIFLWLVAAMNYPGGSQVDPASSGYDWQHNYLSDLFSATAVNGQDSSARPWAMAGMLLFSLSFGGFFVTFSHNIPKKGAARVIKYGGIGAVVAAFLTVTSYHDLMLTIAAVLALISCFYVVVFVLQSKLHLLKALSVLFLLAFYASAYLYFARTQLELLPIMQKLTLLLSLVWMLSLGYFARKEDFQSKGE